jgi:Cyclic nucleotide-binding domain
MPPVAANFGVGSWIERRARITPGEARPPQHLKYESGQVIFEQGARSDLVYTIEDGEVEIVRHRADGAEEALAVLGPGRYSASLGRCSACSARPPPGPSSVPSSGYSARDFRELVGSGRLAEAIRQASCQRCPSLAVSGGGGRRRSACPKNPSVGRLDFPSVRMSVRSPSG